MAWLPLSRKPGAVPPGITSPLHWWNRGVLPDHTSAPPSDDLADVHTGASAGVRFVLAEDFPDHGGGVVLAQQQVAQQLGSSDAAAGRGCFGLIDAGHARFRRGIADLSAGWRVLKVGGRDVDTVTPMRPMMFTVMTALAQMELEIKREHITDSVAKRRAAGKDLGGRRPTPRSVLRCGCLSSGSGPRGRTRLRNVEGHFAADS